jgi:site-specific recombinase XerD
MFFAKESRIEERERMRDLNYDLKQMCLRNPTGSRATQSERFNGLQRCADDLHSLGFRHMRKHSLDAKHVPALVGKWKDKDKLSTGSIKNNLSHIRWWAEQINKKGVVLKKNEDYGIQERVYVNNQNKAKSLAELKKIENIKDLFIKASVQLMTTHGVRKEECLKMRVHEADQGDRLVLKSSWCKGGRPREILIRTKEQRAAIDFAKSLVGKNESLIPKNKSYIQQERHFDYIIKKSDLNNMHGFRHLWAHERYFGLTGFKCPAAGGPTRKELTKEQRLLDRDARQIVTLELGHNRSQITANYLGR